MVVVSTFPRAQRGPIGAYASHFPVVLAAARADRWAVKG